MTSVITSEGLGLFNSSFDLLGNSGKINTGRLGATGGGAFVNAMTGNLVLQQQDEYLVGLGIDTSVLRTYNSMGALSGNTSDGNQDLFRFSFNRRILLLDGKLIRIGEDGKQTIFENPVVQGLWTNYTSNDGSGAVDKLTYNSSTNEYIWTDGATQSTEKYQFFSAGNYYRLVSTTDADGNVANYTYHANGLLETITDAATNTSDKQTLRVVYASPTSTQVVRLETVRNGTTTQTLVRYQYDTSGRLTQVDVDLTPTDNDASDGKVFRTTYTYDGTSKRVATVTQSDGTFLGIQYVQDAALNYRVSQITRGSINSAEEQRVRYQYDTVNRTTTITQVTNLTTNVGLTTILAYDIDGQLISVRPPEVPGATKTRYYTYDTAGNLKSEIDELGKVTEYRYYPDGNLKEKADALGFVTRYTYNTANQVLTQSQYQVADPDGLDGSGQPASPLTSRYVYHATKLHQLRFSVDAKGFVTEYQYNTLGQLASQRVYSNAYSLNSLLAEQSIDLSVLEAWASTQAQALSSRTDYAYDFRGQIQHRTEITDFAAGTGPRTYYIYDQSGRLLKEVSALGVAPLETAATAPTSFAHNKSNFETLYVYDGAGRLLARTDEKGYATTTQYSGNQVIVSDAGGLQTLEVFNTAGQLVSHQESDTASSQIFGVTGYAYNVSGNTLTKTDANGKVSYQIFNARSQLAYDVDAAGYVTEYEYDSNGKGHVVKTRRYDKPVQILGTETITTALQRLTPEVEWTVGTAGVLDVNASGITKTSATASWYGVRSNESYQQAVQLEFSFGALNKQARMGLNLSSSAATTGDIDFAFGVTASSAIEIYEETAVVKTLTIPQKLGNRYRITLENDVVRYYVREEGTTEFVLVHTSARAVSKNYVYFADGEFLDQGASIKDISLTKMDWQETRYIRDARGLVKFEIDPERYVTEHDYDAQGQVIATRRYENPLPATGVALTEAGLQAWTGRVKWQAPSGNAGLVVDGNRVYVQSTASATWSRGIRSEQTVRGAAYLEFTVDSDSKNVMIGLNASNTSSDYYDLDFAMYFTGNNTVEVYEEATGGKGAKFSHRAGNRYRIAIEDGFVNYYVQNEGSEEFQRFFYSSLSLAAQSLDYFADTAFYSPDASISNIVLSTKSNTAYAETRYVRDARGQVQYEIDAKGYVTEYTYDAAGKVTVKTRYDQRPIGEITRLSPEAISWQAAQGADVVISGNNISLGTTALSEWTHSARSNQVITGAGFVEFGFGSTGAHVLAGLNSADVSRSDTDLEFAFYANNTNGLYISEEGVNKGQVGTHQAGNRYRIEIKDGVVRYSVQTAGNEPFNLVYTSKTTVKDTTPYFVDTALYQAGSSVNNVKLISLGTSVRTHYVYNKQGQVRFEIDAKGYVTEFDYDAKGQVIASHRYQVALPDTGVEYSESGVRKLLPRMTWVAPLNPNIDVSGSRSTLARGSVNGTDGQISEQTISGDGYVEFSLPATNKRIMFGLNSVDTSGLYQDIEFAFYAYNNGAVMIYENGNGQGSFGTQNPANRYRIAIEGGVVKYYIKAAGQSTFTLVRTSTSAVDTSKSYFADGTFMDLGAAVDNVWMSDTLQDVTVSSTYFVRDARGQVQYEVDGEGYVTEYEYDAKGQVTLKRRHEVPAQGVALTEPALRQFLEGVTWQAPQGEGLVVDGNRVYLRDGQNAGWSRSVRSNQFIQGQGTVEFSVTSSARDVMVGFNTADAATSYSDINYAIYVSTSNGVWVYEENSNKGGSFLTHQVGNRYRISLEGGGAKYYYQTSGSSVFTLFYTSLIPLETNSLYFVDTAFYGAGGSIENVTVSNAQNRPVSETRYVRDARGMVCYEIDANLYVTQYKYDAGGRVIAIHKHQAPLPTIFMNYTVAGIAQLLSSNTLYQNPSVTQMIRDNLGQVQYEVDAKNFVTEYEYDNKGQVIAQSRYQRPITALTELAPEAVRWGTPQGSNVVISGNSVSLDASAVAGWTHGLPTTDSISGNGVVEFGFGATGSQMLGLSRMSTTASYTDIEYAIYQDAGAVYIFENGINKGRIGTYGSGNRYRIELKNGYANYYIQKAGQTARELVYTSVTTADKKAPYYVDTALYQAGGSITNVTVTELGQASTTRYVRDDRGQVKYEIDAEGYVTEYAYDAAGQVVSTRKYNESIRSVVVPFTEDGIRSALAQAITWQNPGANVTATGNTLVNNVATSWSHGVRSNQTIQGNGFIEFDMPVAARVMVGLNSSDTTSVYTDIDYAFFAVEDGRIQIYEEGNLRATLAAGALKAGNRYRIELKNGVARYYIRTEGTSDYALVHTSQLAVDQTKEYFVDTSFEHVGATARNVRIHDARQPGSAETQYVRDDRGQVKYEIDPNGDYTAYEYDDQGQTVAARRLDVRQNPVSWQPLQGSGLVLNANQLSLADSASAAWTRSVRSDQTLKVNGEVEFTVNSTGKYLSVGLDSVDSNTSYSDIEFTFYFNSSNSVSVMQNGGIVGNALLTHKAGNRYKIVVANGIPQYFVKEVGSENYRLLYSSQKPLTANIEYFLDAAFYSPGASISDVSMAGAVLSETRFIRDTRGQVQYEVDVNRYVTQYKYDAAGRVITTFKYLAPLPATFTSFTVDGITQTLSANTIYQNPSVTRMIRDNLGQVRFEIDAEGFVKEYEYDAKGQVIRRHSSEVAVPLSVELTESGLETWLTKPQAVTWTYTFGSVSGGTGTGTLVTNSSAVAGWSHGANSHQVLKGEGYIEFSLPEDNKRAMVGLNNSQTSTGYSDINYALYVNSDRTIQIYEENVWKITSSTFTHNVGNRYRIAIEEAGRKVRYYVKTPQSADFQLIYDSAVIPTAGASYFVDASIATPSTTVANFVISNKGNGQSVAVGQTTQFIRDARGQVKYDIDANRYVTEYEYDAKGQVITSHRYPVALPDKGVEYTETGVRKLLPKMTWAAPLNPNVDVVGSRSTLARGTVDWTDDQISEQTISGDGYVEFSLPATNKRIMFGLNSVDSAGTYHDIEFAFYAYNNGSVLIYENGVQQSGVFGTQNPGNRYRIAIESGVAKYYIKAAGQSTFTLVRTSTGIVDTSKSYFADGSFMDLGAVVDNVWISDTLQDVKIASTYSVRDERGLVIYEIDANRFVTQYQYDTKGQVIVKLNYTKELPLTFTTYTVADLAYFLANDPVFLNPQTTQYLRDSRGQVRYEIDAERYVTAYTYDAAGAVILTQKYETILPVPVVPYTDATLAATLSSLLSKKTRSVRDGLGQVRFEIDNLGYVTESVRDAQGNMVQTIRYATAYSGSTWTETALAAFATTNASAATNQRTYFVYDRLGQVRFQLNSLGFVQEFEYTAQGQVSRQLSYAKAYTLTNALTETALESWVTQSANRTANQDRINQFFYDDRGSLIYQIDAGGYLTAKTYNAAGQVIEQIRYARTDATLLEDATLTEVQTFAAQSVNNTAEAKQVTRFFYNDLGQLTFQVDALNYVTEYQYNYQGQVTEEVRYSTAMTGTISEPALLALDWTTDNAARVTRYGYDDRGQKVSLSQRLRETTGDKWITETYTYDAQGNRVQIKDALNNITSFVYNKRGELTLKLTPIVGMEETANSALRYGAVTKYTYDAFGNRLTEKQFANKVNLFSGSQQRYASDLVEGTTAGVDITSNTNPETGDRLTEYVYDGLNRIERIIKRQWVKESDTVISDVVTKNEYDSFGNLKNLIEADGSALKRVTHFEYNTLNQMIEETKGLADTSAATIDNRYIQFDARNSYFNYTSPTVTGFTTGGANRVQITQFRYDGFGNVASTLDGRGVSLLKSDDIWAKDEREASGWARDRASLTLTDQIEIERRYTRYQEFDTKGQKIGEYRLDELTGAKVYSTQSSYDAFGNLIRAKDGNGNTGAFVYDTLNRLRYNITPKLTDQIDPLYYNASYFTEYVYDAVGNLTQEIRYSNASTSGATLMANAYLTPSDVNTSFKQATTPVTGSESKFVFDTLGRLTQKENLIASSPLTYAKERYVYDDLGRVVKKFDAYALAISSTPLDTAAYIYTYNAAGQLTQRTTPQVVVYTTTAGTGQAVTATSATQSIIDKFTFDVFGNLTQETKASGISGQTRLYNYRYNKLNQLVRKDEPLVATLEFYSTMTTPTAYTDRFQTTTWQYDLLGNQLSEAKSASTTTLINQGEIRSTEYRYNNLGERILTKLADGSVTIQSFDAAGNIARERKLGSLLTTTYDALISGIADNYREITKRYDADNRLIATATREETFFDLNKIIRDGSQDPTDAGFYTAAATTRNYYDKAGNLVAVRNANFAMTYYFYNERGDRVMEVDPLGYVIEKKYDYAGNLKVEKHYAKKLEDIPFNQVKQGVKPIPEGKPDEDRETHYAYDGLGRRTSETKKGVSVSSFNPTTKVYVRASTDIKTTMGYNALGNLIKVTQPDANGVPDANSVYDYTFDALGRLTEEQHVKIKDYEVSTLDVRKQVIRRYNAFGEEVQRVEQALKLDGTGVKDSRTYSQVRNAQGNVTRELDAENNGKDFSYNVFGEMTKDATVIDNYGNVGVTDAYPAWNDTSDRTIYTHYQRDKLGREIHRVEVDPGQIDVLPLIYDTGSWYNLVPFGSRYFNTQYNAFGEMSGRGEGVNGTTRFYQETWRYDKLGRVSLTNEQDDVRKTYNYDAAGNRTLELKSITSLSDSYWNAKSYSPLTNQFKVNRYDAKGQLLDVFEVPMELDTRVLSRDFAWVTNDTTRNKLISETGSEAAWVDSLKKAYTQTRREVSYTGTPVTTPSPTWASITGPSTLDSSANQALSGFEVTSAPVENTSAPEKLLDMDFVLNRGSVSVTTRNLNSTKVAQWKLSYRNLADAGDQGMISGASNQTQTISNLNGSQYEFEVTLEDKDGVTIGRRNSGIASAWTLPTTGSTTSTLAMERVIITSESRSLVSGVGTTTVNEKHEFRVNGVLVYIRDLPQRVTTQSQKAQTFYHFTAQGGAGPVNPDSVNATQPNGAISFGGGFKEAPAVHITLNTTVASSGFAPEGGFSKIPKTWNYDFVVNNDAFDILTGEVLTAVVEYIDGYDYNFGFIPNTAEYKSFTYEFVASDINNWLDKNNTRWIPTGITLKIGQKVIATSSFRPTKSELRSITGYSKELNVEGARLIKIDSEAGADSFDLTYTKTTSTGNQPVPPLTNQPFTNGVYYEFLDASASYNNITSIEVTQKRSGVVVAHYRGTATTGRAPTSIEYAFDRSQTSLVSTTVNSTISGGSTAYDNGVANTYAKNYLRSLAYDYFLTSGNSMTGVNVDPSILRTSRVYNAFGAVEEQRDARRTEDSNGTSAYTVNPLNGSKMKAYKGGKLTEFDYSKFGQVIEQRLPVETSVDAYWTGADITTSPTIRSHYDQLGNLISTQDANHSRLQQLVDLGSTSLAFVTGGVGTFYNQMQFSNGQIVRKTDRLNNVTQYFYDVHGNLRKEINALGERVDYLYDGDNNRTEIQRYKANSSVRIDINGDGTDDLGEKFTYDELGNLIKHTDALSKPESYVYDRFGRQRLYASFTGGLTHTVYTPTVGSIASAFLWTKDVYSELYTQHRGTTTNADLNKLTERYNYFGRLMSKNDLGDHEITYEYNQAGWLITQSGATSASSSTARYGFNRDNQFIDNYYYLNGLLRSVVDRTADPVNGFVRNNTLSSLTGYAYDQVGNRTREKQYTTSMAHRYNPPVISQDSVLTYDALNRLKSVKDGRFSTSYKYDLNGNRISVVSSFNQYQDLVGTQTSVQTTAGSQTLSYQYDREDRMTYSGGLNNSLYKPTETSYLPYISSIPASASRGVYSTIAYDALGRRKSENSTLSVTETFNFTWDGWSIPTQLTDYLENSTTYSYNELGAVKQVDRKAKYTVDVNTTWGFPDGGSVQYDLSWTEHKAFYDQAGRAVKRYQYEAPTPNLSTFNPTPVVYSGKVIDYTEVFYSSDNALLREESYLDDTKGKRKKTLAYTYLSDGKTVSKTVQDQYRSDGVTKDVTITLLHKYFDYDKFDTFKISRVTIDGYSTDPNIYNAGWKEGEAEYHYDANGNNRYLLDIHSGRSIYYQANHQGQILQRVERNNKERIGQAPITRSFYYANGNVIGDVGNDDVDSRLNMEQAAYREKYPGTRPVAIESADFDQNFVQVNKQLLSSAPTFYTARAGDSLQSVARTVWGDPQMWYLIADANGLSADTQLVEGQNLKIPNTIANVHNNVNTSRPYDTGLALGDTNPTLPDPPPVPPKDDDDCGWKQIVLVVVAIVAAVVVGPAVFLAVSEALAAGAAVLGASAAVAGAVGFAGGALAAAFAVEAVNQTAAIGLGLQEGGYDFNFREIAAQAVTNMILPVDASSYMSAFVKGAVNAAIGSQVQKAFGVEGASFSWRKVAVSSLSAMASHGLDSLGLADGKSYEHSLRGENFSGELDVNGAINAIGNELVSTAINTGVQKMVYQGDHHFNWASTLQNVFTPDSGIGEVMNGFAAKARGYILTQTVAGKALANLAEKADVIGRLERGVDAFDDAVKSVIRAISPADEHTSRPVSSFSLDMSMLYENEFSVNTHPVSKIFDANDPHQYLMMPYFDGSWNFRDESDFDFDTNVAELQILSDDANNKNVFSPYIPGVGTSFGTEYFGGATGAGITSRVVDAYWQVVGQANQVFDVDNDAQFVFGSAGFSRGATEARMFANYVVENGIPRLENTVDIFGNTQVVQNGYLVEPSKVRIGAMVLFDTVSTGFGDWYDLSIPAQAQNVLHITARDENRFFFPLVSANVEGVYDPRILELASPGAHSNVGGTYDRNGLGDFNLSLAHTYMGRLGIPLAPIPSAYQPKPDQFRIHDSRSWFDKVIDSISPSQGRKVEYQTK